MLIPCESHGEKREQLWSAEMLVMGSLPIAGCCLPESFGGQEQEFGSTCGSKQGGSG